MSLAIVILGLFKVAVAYVPFNSVIVTSCAVKETQTPTINLGLSTLALFQGMSISPW